MNIQELKQRIIEEGLSTVKHNLGDRPISEDEIGLIITQNEWQVYQSHERGGYHIVESFNNESDACERIYKSLKAQKDFNDYWDVEKLRRKSMKQKKDT